MTEFGRLKELSKISVLVQFLVGIHQDNIKSLEAINFILAPQILAPQTEIHEKFLQTDAKIRQKTAAIFNNTNPEFSVRELRKFHRNQLIQMKNNIGTLNYDSNSPEVNEYFEAWVNTTVKSNYYRFSANYIRNELRHEKENIARKLSEEKIKLIRNELKEMFCSDGVVKAFLRGNVEPAAELRVKNNLKEQFPESSEADITAAMAKNETAIERIGIQSSHKFFIQKKDDIQVIEKGFDKINLGKNKEPVDQSETCLWVPASVRHDVQRDEETGLTRYSFFVYGGVSINPKVNIVQGGGPLRGNPVGSVAFNRMQATRGFQDHHIASNKNSSTRNHDLWKLAGIDINSRTNKIYLPTKAEQHPTRSIHNGRHTNSYSETIAKQMNSIVRQGKAANWTPDQYRAATRQAFAEIRQGLRSGTIGLNKVHRPHAKQW